MLAFSSIIWLLSLRLVAQWMALGFTHGVLNTDNLSLLAITIDYGPFGFLDAYDPDYVPNHSDDGGRYQYDAQPDICKWNLSKLATALTAVIPGNRLCLLNQLFFPTCVASSLNSIAFNQDFHIYFCSLKTPAAPVHPRRLRPNLRTRAHQALLSKARP